MKQIILATALTLIVSSAFAMDKFLGDTSEYTGQLLLDHGPGAKTEWIDVNHDHGDNVALDFMQHDHELAIKQRENDSREGDTMGMHDHGDDISKDFYPHPH